MKANPKRSRVAKAGEVTKADVNRLADMDIEEVSAVKAGANRKTFAVVKSEGDPVISIMQLAVKLGDTEDDCERRSICGEIAKAAGGYAGVGVGDSLVVAVEKGLALIAEKIGANIAVKSEPEPKVEDEGVSKLAEQVKGMADLVKLTASRVSKLEGGSGATLTERLEKTNNEKKKQVEWPASL